MVMHEIITISKNEISTEHIKKAKENIDLLHIPNFIPSTTGWDEFIDHCDFTVKSPERTLSSPVKVINALQIWDELFVAGYYVNEGNCFHQLPEVIFITESLYGRKSDGGCTLINFVGMQKTIPIHHDTRDSFLWQAIGSVEWRIFENYNNIDSYKTLLVNPGDVLFVPSGIIHTVFCEKPRAGISIFYDKQQ